MAGFRRFVSGHFIRPIRNHIKADQSFKSKYNKRNSKMELIVIAINCVGALALLAPFAYVIEKIYQKAK